MFQKKVIRYFLQSLENITHGSISITMPDGKKYHYQGINNGVDADITIHDNQAIISFATKGDIGFAEDFRDGLWDCQKLTNLLIFSLQNEDALDKYIYGSFFARSIARIGYIFSRNTIAGSKKNIFAHYDLGNDFYALWLDSSMTYSSALFANKTTDLTEAQYCKYDRIINRLSRSGKLLEIGCGWGGFAERALATNDYHIKGITISDKQHEYALNRLQEKNATIALEDYRIQQGKYDHIVSIEMFEAVGERFWPIYFSKIQSLLANKGKAIIQTILIKENYFVRYQKGGDLIRTFIFPGGMLPSFNRFVQASTKANLVITDSFAFGKDYALTLHHWLTRFEQRLEEVQALGFTEQFTKIWRLYLASCIASFSVGRTDVMQIELQHAHNL